MFKCCYANGQLKDIRKHRMIHWVWYGTVYLREKLQLHISLMTILLTKILTESCKSLIRFEILHGYEVTTFLRIMKLQYITRIDWGCISTVRGQQTKLGEKDLSPGPTLSRHYFLWFFFLFGSLLYSRSMLLKQCIKRICTMDSQENSNVFLELS